MRIDCDAHVDETEETWAHISPEVSHASPVTVDAGSRTWMWPGRSHYILGFGTQDSLLLGTDYGHADQSTELRVHQVIEQRVADGTLAADVARKLLADNARRFYGI